MRYDVACHRIGPMMNTRLQNAIRSKFRNQRIFANAIGRTEGYLSEVIHCKKKLTNSEQMRWALKLRSRVEDIFQDDV